MRISAFNRSCERKQSRIYPSRSLKKVAIRFDHDPILFSAANPADEVFGRHNSRKHACPSFVIDVSDGLTTGAADAVIVEEEVNWLVGHKGVVTSAVCSPDGRRVVTASETRVVTAYDDNTARVWDAATGAVIAVLKGHVLVVKDGIGANQP